MEKFSTWRDKSSGIHPFIPVVRKPTSFFSFFLTILKAPFFIATLSMWLIVDYIFQIFGVYNACGLIDWFFGNVALMIHGFVLPSAGFQSAGFRNGGSAPLNTLLTSRVRSSGTIRKGDIILCNCQSPMDLLLIKTYLSKLRAEGQPHFTWVDPQSGEVYLLDQNCLLTLMLHHGDISSGRSSLKAKLLNEQMLKNANGPVVIFPEATTSNGKGLLKLIAQLQWLPPTQRIHLLAIKYSDPSVITTPTMPPRNLWQLFGQFFIRSLNIAEASDYPWMVKWISAESLRSAPQTSIIVFDPQDVRFMDSLGQLFCALLHCKSLNISAADKVAFLKTAKCI